MSDTEPSGCRYGPWKGEIRSDLEALEGYGPPSVDELWNSAQNDARLCVARIDNMPPTKEAIEELKGDLLRSLVALEMAEELLEDSQNGGKNETS